MLRRSCGICTRCTCLDRLVGRLINWSVVLERGTVVMGFDLNRLGCEIESKLER
jgi:hypothetical protein